MARVTGLTPGRIIEVRSAASGVIAIDNATLSDANYPVANGLNCKGYDSIFVGVEITAGTNPTMTILPLFRDDDAADQQRWKKLLVGAGDGSAVEGTGALAPFLTLQELNVHGHALVYLQIAAVTNTGSTNGWKILAMPGRVRAALNR